MINEIENSENVIFDDWWVGTYSKKYSQWSDEIKT